MSVPTIRVKSTSAPKRALALDALRGLAILGMALSGLVPYGVLPSWMYHAQVPPPNHVFDGSIPGITWVDLVFPFFLFSMGAAFPLALRRKTEDGTPYWKLSLHLLERGVLLLGFGVYIQHIRPYSLNPSPQTETWVTALVGFLILFPVLTRLPKSWNQKTQWAIRLAGWAAVIILMLLVRFPDDKKLSIARNDIIIIVLANMAFFGGLIWLLTRDNWMLRLGVLGAMIGFRLAQKESGWVSVVWSASPIPSLYRFGFLQYLFIVLPGTIAGDQILSWIQSPQQDTESAIPWTSTRNASLLALMIAFNLTLLVGLMGRWVVTTVILSLLLSLMGSGLVRRPNTDTEKLIRTLFFWGVAWLLLGLVFEPYEGGIKKDRATMSYYFVTTGLAIFTLIAFMIVIDVWNKKRWAQIFVHNGQNPMIAYVAIPCLLPPLLALTPLGHWFGYLARPPWLGALGAALKTLLLALFVQWLTRKKVFWRT